MANLQDDSLDLHIADAPRARTIGIRASARIITQVGRCQDFQLQALGLCPPLTSVLADGKIVVLSF
jgi:hypothetical protein